jgi:hypothetical protein
MLYDDDRFHPTAQLDNDELKPLSNTNDFEDPYLNKIKRSYIDNAGKKQFYTLEYYFNGDVGSHIRNAVTGIKYKNYIVGTKSERCLFKTIMPMNDTSSKPHILFYNNPREYEQHQCVTLAEKTIQRWLKNKEEATTTTA